MTAPRPDRRQALAALRFVLGFAVPTALYYVLRAAGVSVYWTLVVTAVAPTAVAVVRWLRTRQADGFSLYMLTLMTLSTAISFVSGSPRTLLARDGWLTGVSGLWFLGSVRAARPLAYHYTRPLLQRRTRAAGVAADWDELWERLPRFRRVWRVASVLWGIALLADCGLRVAMAYTLPVDEVPALGTALYVATSLVLIVVTNIYYIAIGLYDGRSALYAPLAEPAPAA